MEGINNENENGIIRAIAILDAKQKKVFENVGNISDNLDIAFLRNGLSISQLDNNEIMFNKAFLNASILPQYINKTNQDFKVNIDAKNFRDILKTFDKKSNLILKISEQDIIVSNNIKNVKIRLNDYISKEFNFNDLEFQTGIKLNYEDFINILKDVKVVSSYITFIFNKDDKILHIEATSSGSIDYECDIPLNPDAILKSNENIKLTFDIEYLEKIIKNIDKKSVIKLYFKQNDILKIIYLVNGIENICYIAPILEF